MKTIVVLSDTHGARAVVEEMMPIFAEADYIVHLGDGAGDMREVSAKYPEKTFVCKGNCDGVPALYEYTLEVERARIFLCHGDRYGVKRGVGELIKRAKEEDCSVALYGHTHQAEVREVDGVLTVCPGTAHSPKWAGGSYAYLTVQGGSVHAVIVGGD